MVNVSGRPYALLGLCQTLTQYNCNVYRRHDWIFQYVTESTQNSQHMQAACMQSINGTSRIIGEWSVLFYIFYLGVVFAVVDSSTINVYCRSIMTKKIPVSHPLTLTAPGHWATLGNQRSGLSGETISLPLLFLCAANIRRPGISNPHRHTPLGVPIHTLVEWSLGYSFLVP